MKIDPFSLNWTQWQSVGDSDSDSYGFIEFYNTMYGFKENKGPPKPPATRCNIILLSAGVGISLPRPFTLVISPKVSPFSRSSSVLPYSSAPVKKKGPLARCSPPKKGLGDGVIFTLKRSICVRITLSA